jgi:hypothetical protein
MDNIKKDLLEIGANVVDWIGLAQDRYRWRALVNSVMKLRVPYNAGNYREAARVVASRAVLSSTELVSYLSKVLRQARKCLNSRTLECTVGSNVAILISSFKPRSNRMPVWLIERFL